MRIGVLVLAVVLMTPALASAQQAQAGVSYAAFSLSHPDETRHGVGGWFSWDFIDATSRPGLLVGLDTALNVFPGDDPVVGRQAQLFGGLRAGLRGDRFAAVGRLRPGLVRFSRRFLAPNTVCIAIFPPPEACLTDERNFAVDVGVTFELESSPRTLVRVDVGNTLVRFDRRGRDHAWTNNLQFGAGAGIRF